MRDFERVRMQRWEQAVPVVIPMTNGCLGQSLFLQVHFMSMFGRDGTTPLSESVAALEDMRRAGKIDMIGLSNVSRSQVEDALKVAPIAAVQNRYSPADEHDAALEETIDWLNEQGIAFMAHGPLGANPMKQGATVEPGDALRTLLARAPNVLVIPGTTTIAHLENNANVLAA